MKSADMVVRKHKKNDRSWFDRSTPIHDMSLHGENGAERGNLVKEIGKSCSGKENTWTIT